MIKRKVIKRGLRFVTLVPRFVTWCRGDKTCLNRAIEKRYTNNINRHNAKKHHVIDRLLKTFKQAAFDDLPLWAELEGATIDYPWN